MYQEHSVQPASTREVAAGLTSGLPQLLPGLSMQAFERLVADLRH